MKKRKENKLMEVEISIAEDQQGLSEYDRP